MLNLLLIKVTTHWIKYVLNIRCLFFEINVEVLVNLLWFKILVANLNLHSFIPWASRKLACYLALKHIICAIVISFIASNFA